jgi:hypothetical protein
MVNDPESVIQRELDPTEKLLWYGRPPLGLRLRAHDAFLIPFSLMWGGFAIFWEVSVVAQGAGLFFAIWGVPFVLIGLYLIIGRFFVDAWQREKTYYGITPQRIIIVPGLLNRNVKSLNLHTLSDLSVSERTSGSGTITFGPTPPWWVYPGGGWPGMGHYAAPSLELEKDAREVYEIIRNAQQANRSARNV